MSAAMLFFPRLKILSAIWCEGCARAAIKSIFVIEPRDDRGQSSRSRVGFEVAPEIGQADLARIESGDQSRLSGQKRAARGFAYHTTVLEARCYRLQAEMNDWLAGRRALKPVFDGTVGGLINFYQTDKESPYHALEPASRHPYDVYARMIVEPWESGASMRLMAAISNAGGTSGRRRSSKAASRALRRRAWR